MNVVVQGTKEFSDYTVFMRAMGVALSDIRDDTEFVVYSAGPAQINSFASEFCNMSEAGLRNRGIKVKMVRVPPSYVEENLGSFDYFAFLASPNQHPSRLAKIADASGIETGIFKY